MIEYSHLALCVQYDINMDRARKQQNGEGDPQTPTFSCQKQEEVASTPTEATSDATMLEPTNVTEIDASPQYFYSFLCNRWISLTGCIVKFVVMFLVHWQYSLLYIIFGVLIWFYVGKTAPGLNPGIAKNFSIVKYAQYLFGALNGSDVGDLSSRLVVPPMHPPLETESSRLTEENT